MKQTFLLLLILCIAVSAKTRKKSEWYKLEREVKFEARSEEFIDSLKKEYTIENPAEGTTPVVDNRLPKYDKAVYRLKWGIFQVGYGYVENEVKDGTLFNIGKAVTSGLVAHFLKVRDFVCSFSSVDGLYPYFFQQDMYEDGLTDKVYQRRKWAIYDHVNNRVKKWDGKKMKDEEISSFTNNYMTLLYNLRNSNFAIGDTITYPCFVHGKNYQLKTIVRKRETIKVPAGTFKCFKVQPILVGHGHGFNEKDKMFLWIDTKYPHLMIQASADARLGKVRARLEHYEVAK